MSIIMKEDFNQENMENLHSFSLKRSISESKPEKEKLAPLKLPIQKKSCYIEEKYLGISFISHKFSVWRINT